MAVFVILVALTALFCPPLWLWVQTSWIPQLLMVVMFGMGLTLKLDDFRAVVTRPLDVLLGCAAQFIIMPALAFLLGKAFNLPGDLLAGVALVGACPGGTSSNVVTYLAKGDVALSVAMTSVNTFLAPILTPWIVYLLVHSSIDVNVKAMFLSIASVVLAPIILGLVVNRLFGKFTAKLIPALPFVSMLAICLIVASVVAATAKEIRATGALVFIVVFLHNTLGYLAGFAIGKAINAPSAKTRALAIEIGMQNSGLATSLAKQVFATAPLAAAPGAIFSVWHNISGAILAAALKRWDERKNKAKNDGHTDEQTDVKSDAAAP